MGKSQSWFATSTHQLVCNREYGRRPLELAATSRSQHPSNVRLRPRRLVSGHRRDSRRGCRRERPSCRLPDLTTGNTLLRSHDAKPTHASIHRQYDLSESNAQNMRSSTWQIPRGCSNIHGSSECASSNKNTLTTSARSYSTRSESFNRTRDFFSIGHFHLVCSIIQLF